MKARTRHIVQAHFALMVMILFIVIGILVLVAMHG